jgi:hypothetical protein
MRDRFRGKSGKAGLCVILALALLVAGALISAGCQSGTGQFKAQWANVMKQFNTRVAADDKKAEALAAKKDLAGVINLVKQRIVSVDETLGKVLALSPPGNLRKLDALSIYYLQTLEDRLQAQNSLYEAALSGSPTTDLQQVLDRLVARNEQIARELNIELQKDGISIEAESPKQSTPTAPSNPNSSTSPSTAPR